MKDTLLDKASSYSETKDEKLNGDKITVLRKVWMTIAEISYTTTNINCMRVCFLPIVWTLVDLSPAVWILLNWFEGLGVWGLFFHLDHIWGAGLGSRREATQCGQCRGTIRVQAFSLQLDLCQEHLPPLYLFLQLVIVGLGKKSHFSQCTHKH